MEEEYESILKNKTWDLVELPEGKQPIGCKWLHKPKFKADGSIDKYKARVVAKGYLQKEGIDYEETFAPIAKLNTIRLLIFLATKHRWAIHRLDVKSAFLNGELKEEVYLVQPEGFVKQGEEHLLCRLKKALYGLKQAPKLRGNANELIKEIKEEMSQVFDMKDLGELRYCLGLEVWRDADQTFLSQGKYVKSLLENFRIDQCKATTVPLE
eukprot:PITA_05746